MKTIIATLLAISALCSVGLTQAQAQTKDEKKTISQVVDSATKRVEHDFVPAAEAMPEDKYSFAPTNGEFKGVRTFAEQIKHVAATNYLVASLILGEKPPVEINDEKGPDSVKSKAEILKYLKDSYAYAHKAVATITEANVVEPIPSFDGKSTTTRLSLAMLFAWHGYDHYGQMVEYLRMNGIVPPASRK
ncbi:MAG: DinB family protein [Terriglobales bacterium]